jgi:hypothetical protein
VHLINTRLGLLVLLLVAVYRQYKVYDMAKDYKLLFTLPAANVVDLKLGPDYLLMLQRTQPITRRSSTSSSSGLDAGLYHAVPTVRASHVLVGPGVEHEVQNSPTPKVMRPRELSMPLLVYAAANGQVGDGAA